ncbi:MAG TPA: aldehyde dehydrogenase family protein, partial [Methylomirabilota bacterium]|nr:aldehyde dehydrogenase family protein [Methylomirabilota bacterium]
MSLHGNLINGEWVRGGDVNRDVNPSNVQEVVGEYARADAAQAQAAIAAARAAFPAWSRGNRQERADLLDRVGDEILRRAEELGTLLSREEG